MISVKTPSGWVEAATTWLFRWLTTYPCINGLVKVDGTWLQVCASSGTPPDVSTGAASDVTEDSATVEGEILDTGDSSVTQHGHCWSTSANPNLSNSHTSLGSGSAGTFTSQLTGLSDNTTYHYRAYATNSSGTTYGADMTFTTEEAAPVPVAPSVSTGSAHDITDTTAIIDGEIIDIGSEEVTAYGHCVSYSSNPGEGDMCTDFGAAANPLSFSSNLAGFNPGDTVYYKAYAENPVGRSWGSEKSFTFGEAPPPEEDPPTVTTDGVQSVGETDAVVEGTIVDTGDASVTAHGHCLSTSSNPDLGDQHTDLGSGGVGGFQSSFSSLAAATTYHYRAYATNAYGTDYGNDRTFTTGSPPPEEDPPTVVTGSAHDITDSEAQLDGEITDIGDATVTAYGHCVSTSSNPDLGDDCVDHGSTSSPRSFTSQISNMPPETTFHYRAFATNQFGTSYGADKTYTTDAAPAPDVTHIQTFRYEGNGVDGRQIDFPGIDMSTSGSGMLIVRRLTGSDGATMMFLAKSGLEGYGLAHAWAFEDCSWCMRELGNGYCKLSAHLHVNQSGYQYSMIVIRGTNDSGSRYFWGNLHTEGGYTHSHGLGAVPNIMWCPIDQDVHVPFYFDQAYFTPEDNALYMGTTGARQDGTTWWQSTPPTSTQFTVAASMYIASALFRLLGGTVAAGTYTGDGNTETIYCGFRPVLVIVKPFDGLGDWTWLTKAMEEDNYYQVGTPNNPSSYSNVANFTDNGAELWGAGMIDSGKNFLWFAIG